MDNFQIIKHKLQQFIRRYYTNELLKGVILFFAIGLLYFLFTLFIEYVLWLSSGLRTFLFWSFVLVEVLLFIKLLVIPVLHLFKLKKGIDYNTASRYIGKHFYEVKDKLLNIIQLNDNDIKTDLLIASIEQKSEELKSVSFSSAVNFKSNIKYLKYAVIPIMILVLSWATGQMNWFNDSYERVVNYQTAYVPPAPFQFFITNKSLQTIENNDFTLNVSTIGNIIPESVKIEYNNQSYFLQQLAPGEFQFNFSYPKENIEFVLSANKVVSKPYKLKVVNTPIITKLEMVLDYPSYTQKQNEVIKSTGSAIVPEGTEVTWKAIGKSINNINIYAQDTLTFNTIEDKLFEAKKHIYNNYNYRLTTSNNALKDYEDLSYTISVVKDQYPELTVDVKKDTTDIETLFFYGQAADDYALSKLQLVYYPSNNESKKEIIPIHIPKTNFSEFAFNFPNQLQLEQGTSYQIYFEAFDNDAIHKNKRTTSSIFTYRKFTKDEKEQKQLQEQKETINNINKTFNKLKAQDKKLQELSKMHKEKPSLNFNDKKKVEDFIKRQKNQEQLMKNFNKKLQKNLDEFQQDKEEDNQFKKDLQERLKENEEQLKKDEKLLEELERLKDKINKEDFSRKLDELAKKNKNKKRSMKQLLELTKRFYVMKKAEKIANALEKLSEEQKQLSNTEEKENTKEKQEQLNKTFDKLQKDIDDLKQDDRRLQKPMHIPRDEFLEDEINQDQKMAKEALEKKENSSSKQRKEDKSKQFQEKAKQKQKSAAKKIKKLSEDMKQAALGGGGGDQTAEDIDMLRQILENLLWYSFDQEALMNTFSNISINNNKYGNYIIKQSNLREHFEHIDDSLFALSLRQPKISENVNTHITDAHFYIDKALDQLSENSLYQGVSSQQYAVTASNELASLLSDILDNMEMSMNLSSGGGGKGEEQLQDIIISQEELNKKMQESLNKKGKKEDDDEGQHKGSESRQNGQKGENNTQGENKKGNTNDSDNSENKEKDGKGGSEQNEENRKNNGYGEGGIEEQNEELFKIYQQQQQLRQALEDKLVKEGKIESAGALIKQMEEIESELLNRGLTNQTLEKMREVQHQLLKLDNAAFTQEQDDKRQSKTNKKDYNINSINNLDTIKKYFNTTEILDRDALPFQRFFKSKVQHYFKTKND